MGLFSGLGTAVGTFFGGPLGAAAGGVIGGLIDQNQGSKAQEDANQRQLDIMHEQQNWQERMRDTSFQARVKDLSAAGLNPMLAVSQGGAAQPGGVQSAEYQNPQAVGTSTAAQGAATAKTVMDIVSSQASIEQTRAVTDRVRAETMTHDMNAAEQASRIGLLSQQTKTAFQDALQKSAQTWNIKTDAERNELLLRAETAGKSSAFQADVAYRKAKAGLAEAELPAAEQEAKYYRDTPGYTGMEKVLQLANPFFHSSANAKRAFSN